TGGDVPLRKAEYGVLSLPTMIGEDPCMNSIFWTKSGRRSILKNVKIRAGIARSSSIAYTFCVDVTQCVLRRPTANPDKNLAPAGFFVF
ncbi:hypothetical protein, partial [Enterobacter asburiae]|uniref:hypothetical protein n=1 Tax=Enterobacter asburiae TaxID=61645 RepID=UPI002076466E